MKIMYSLSQVTWFLILRTSRSWHAYNLTAKYDPSCLKQYPNTENTYEILDSNRFRLWPALVRSQDVRYGRTLFGFREAIEKIWEHQHPTECNNKQFIISSGWQWGFGSVAHVESSAFSIAMELGRIYLPNPDGPIRGNKNDNTWQTRRTSFCSSRGIVSMDCYYEPWSNCTYSDIFGTNNITLQQIINKYPVINDDNFYPNSNGKLMYKKSMNDFQNHKVFILLHTSRNHIIQRYIPSILKPIINCSLMSKQQYFYWWRAISSSYYLRPNKETLRYLSTFRTLAIEPNETCVAIHVRHGDKDSEMTLIPFMNYSKTIEFFYHKNLILHEHISKKIPVFIGTEDPIVLKEAEKWAENSKIFRVIYTNLFDRYSVSARLKYLDRKSFREEMHHDLEYISMLLNLEYALKCDAWVCTLASNTCRLIDELRATVGGKANKPYADLSEETCSKAPIPCIDHEIFVDIPTA